MSKRPSKTKKLEALQRLLLSAPGPERDPNRRELKLPELPTGVRPADMAMDDAGGFPHLGYLNGQTVAGQLGFGLYFPGYPYLSELAQRTEYRQPVETLAKEMTRGWIKFKSTGNEDKREQIEQIEEEFCRHNIQLLFRKVTEHDGFYGLGMVFVRLKGHDDQAAPVVVDSRSIEKGSLEGFVTIEPMWMTPLVWNSKNPTDPSFYNPQEWMVLGVKTHASRMLKFISREIPDIIKPAYNFGGLSLSQMIDPYVQRWLKTVDSVNRLISNFSIIKLATDMANVLQGGAPEQVESVITRLRLFSQYRDNQGVFLHDKESEALDAVNVPISGLAELQAQSLEHMAYPTHEPLVVLTGVTPSGLNASSESEIDVWHSWVHSMQEQLYRPNLTRVLNIVQLSLFGKIDKSITFDFEPLKQLDGRAAAEVRKMAADAAVAYIGAGVTDPQEERERIASDPESGYVNLDVDKDVAPPPLDDSQNDDDDDDEAEAA